MWTNKCFFYFRNFLEPKSRRIQLIRTEMHQWSFVMTLTWCLKRQCKNRAHVLACAALACGWFLAALRVMSKAGWKRQHRGQSSLQPLPTLCNSPPTERKEGLPVNQTVRWCGGVEGRCSAETEPPLWLINNPLTDAFSVKPAGLLRWSLLQPRWLQLNKNNGCNSYEKWIHSFI